MSMTPAFSPGPWITCGPLVGSVRRWTLEDLYEQCSFHIAEKMPSSVSVGSRPIRSSMRWYSSGLRPCSATSSGVILAWRWGSRWLRRPLRALRPAPRTARARRSTPIAGSTWFSGCGIMPSTLPRSLRMPAMALMAPLWFQFGSIMPSGERIAENHPPLAFEPRDGLAVGDVIALAMRHRHADHLAGIVAARERRVGTLDPQIDVAADEAQVARCASARPAAGRPRTGSGSRCRRRAPARLWPAKARTASMIGERAAIAPQRR